MRQWILAFFAGTLSLYCFKTLPPLSWAVFTLPFLSITYFIVPTRWRYLHQLLLAIILGFFWALLHAHAVARLKIPAQLEGKTVSVQGYVSSIPEHQAHGVRFIFNVSKLQDETTTWTLPWRMQLSWQGKVPSLFVGDEWELHVRLKQPRGTQNPGAYDYEKWLFEHRINATGYVYPKANHHLVKQHRLRQPIDRLRQHMVESMKKILKNSPYTGFMTALTVGIRDEILPDQWQVMRRTGTNHLMAIAGLHIGLITGMIFFLFRLLWCRTGKLMHWIPVPQAAATGALLIGLAYSALAGFALPTQRAVIMLAVFLTTTLLRRHLPPWNALLIALFVILILDPLATLSDSFWLSFGAVAMIIYGMNARLTHHHQASNILERMQRIWWQFGRIQWVVAIGLIPFSLMFFQQVSLIGFVANMIAIPWVGFTVLPLALIGSVLLLISPNVAPPILLLAERLLAWVWFIMEWLARSEKLQWYAYVANPSLLLAITTACLLLLATRSFPGRWLAIIWLLPVLIWKPPGPKTGEIWFTLLDVGQGLAAVIQTKNHITIFDTGARFSDNVDMGDSVVLPFLRTRGVREIDALIISHGDNDHIGGAYSILRQLPVKWILTSEPTRFSRAQLCQQGQHWVWDGVTFEILYPQRDNQEKNNDRSCVLRVSNPYHSLLLPGDIERKSEAFLVKNEAARLRSTILVVPHHGSRTSSTPDFIRAVQPRYALFAVGYRNRYRLPNKAVLSRYERDKIALFSTVKSGAIHFKIPAETILAIPTQYRIENKHYWHAKTTEL